MSMTEERFDQLCEIHWMAERNGTRADAMRALLRNLTADDLPQPSLITRAAEVFADKYLLKPLNETKNPDGVIAAMRAVFEMLLRAAPGALAVGNSAYSWLRDAIAEHDAQADASI